MGATMTVGHLSVRPRYDAPLWGLVHGLRSGTEVVVGVAVSDDLGQRWTSSTTLVTGERGVLYLAGARFGDGADPDPYRCYWSIRRDPTTAPPGLPAAVAASPDVAFSDPQPRRFDIDISWPGHSLSETVERCLSSAVLLEPWRDDIIANAFWPTRPDIRPGAVVVVGGSAGGFAWSNQVAALIAASGLPAVSVAYHDWSRNHGLPDRIEEQPLELFMEAVLRLAARTGAGGLPLMGVGFSKGAEALLALAARNPAFDRIAAIAPSSHVCESVRPTAVGPVKSSWSWNGEPLPFARLPLDSAFYEDYDQSRLLDAHRDGLSDAEPSSRIVISDTQLDVLLVSSADDETWPAASMAKQLRASNPPISSITLDGAGHLLLPPGYPAERAGGTSRANAAADRRMWTHLRKFLGIT